MKKHEVQVINVLLDIVVANAATVAEEHRLAVNKAIKAAKRVLAESSKAERLKAEVEAAAALSIKRREEKFAAERAPFLLGQRFKLKGVTEATV